MEYEIFIVYASPSGSTRRVAESINTTFLQKNVSPMVLDLAQADKQGDVLAAIKTAGNRACLLIGSPVYRDQAAPPVVNLLEKLPESAGAYAVPFVTWGKACSGLALWQMGDMLQKKGFQIAGAAKVVAEHCLMWRTDNPPGKGHPDESDRKMVAGLVNTIYKRLESKNVTALSIETLNYHPSELSDQMKKKMGGPWMVIPKKVNQETCTQCAVCEEVCPTVAITLDPYPVFGQSCFDCFNCVRLCPEDAIEPAISMDQIEGHIRDRVQTINEQPLTQIFI